MTYVTSFILGPNIFPRNLLLYILKFLTWRGRRICRHI